MDERVPARVLVLGAAGMLGSTVFRVLGLEPNITTYGTIRDDRGVLHFPRSLRDSLIPGVDVGAESGLLRAFALAKPDAVINCVGIVKQLAESKNYIKSIEINALLPHRLASLCSLTGARLVHFSTDCVFSGVRGGYLETDISDAEDLYGRTKYLGEVCYGDHLTLRTSIIGHELAGSRSLVDWFMAQDGEVNGYRNAIFSGLPTIEVAKILRDLVIANTKLRGLYHLSADPISKYELLNLVADIYGKDISIRPDDEVRIDRSLNSDRFRTATGYRSRPWSELISEMRTAKLTWAAQAESG